MLVVQKYGGTSVSDAKRIGKVAARVAYARRAGNHVAVVVSAMGDTTDQLIKLAGKVSRKQRVFLMDELLTTGEMISASFLAMAILGRGIDAVSLTGTQAGIHTDANHGNAKIREMDIRRVREELDRGKVVIVAGFQGVSLKSGEVTTLGRGGSDTTAVALAAALKADVCEIYTDVEGVFTADPRVVYDARKLDEISYEEMLEMAARGTRVITERAVELGRRYDVPIHIRSSFHDGDGTWIRKEVNMEEVTIRGISHDASEVLLSVQGIPQQPGILTSIFQALAAAGISVDTIVQGKQFQGRISVSCTVPRELQDKALEAITPVAEGMGAALVDVDEHTARVSLVGAGMMNVPGIAAQMFEVVEREVGDVILVVNTSENSVSFHVPEDIVERVVLALHDEFVGNRD